MARLRHCAVCREPFVAKSPNAKYCPLCREAANAAKKADTEKALRAKRRNEKAPHLMAQHDSPEQIRLCLNCKQKICRGACKITGNYF